jgi:hypothetical protein
MSDKWKLVPVKITAEIMAAMQRELPEHQDTIGARLLVECQWQAALAAAPSPEPGNIPANDPATLARVFHETYERLAPQYGYETRADTKAFDPESPNGRLMTHVCAEISNAIFAPAPEPARWTQEQIDVMNESAERNLKKMRASPMADSPATVEEVMRLHGEAAERRAEMALLAHEETK